MSTKSKGDRMEAARRVWVARVAAAFTAYRRRADAAFIAHRRKEVEIRAQYQAKLAAIEAEEGQP